MKMRKSLFCTLRGLLGFILGSKKSNPRTEYQGHEPISESNEEVRVVESSEAGVVEIIDETENITEDSVTHTTTTEPSSESPDPNIVFSACLNFLLKSHKLNMNKTIRMFLNAHPSEDSIDFYLLTEFPKTPEVVDFARKFYRYNMKCGSPSFIKELHNLVLNNY